jgi:hypothetical protein
MFFLHIGSKVMCACAPLYLYPWVALQRLACFFECCSIMNPPGSQTAISSNRPPRARPKGFASLLYAVLVC